MKKARSIVIRALLHFLILLFPVLPVHAEEVPRAAPDINLPAQKGEFHLADMRGKVLYLDFWASWCTPCKKSFPWMSAVKKKFADMGFEVVAVSLDIERADADTFLKKLGTETNFTIAYDSEGLSASEYRLSGMPSSFLIGRDGKIYASHVGFRDKDKPKLESAIERLLSARY